MNPALALYRAAWEPALGLLRALSGAERLVGETVLPPRWRPSERLTLPRLAPGPRLWLHAASLGECKGLWAFAQTLSSLPCGFVLTANTVEARDYLRARAADTEAPSRWHARLAPPDHPRVVRRFLEACGVRGLVLFEVELWPHFIRESRRGNIPVFWISARLTRRAARRYGLFPAAMREILRGIDWTQTHGMREAEALENYGCDPVEVGGDLRGLAYLDAAPLEPSVDGAREAGREGFAFVSFHADELGALKKLVANTREPVYVLPRKAGEFARFASELAPLGFEPVSANPGATRQIVDAFGRTDEILARVRGAVVGGSFSDHGGHNLWEPLAAGVPAAIGPRHESQEYLAARLDAQGLLRVVKNIPAEGVETLFPRSSAPHAPATLKNAAARERAVLRAAAEAARAAIKQRVSFGEAR
jgi:3-deoxy-D-manno-octulosonic-acid transferase